MLAEGADTNTLPLQSWPSREILAIKNAIELSWSNADLSVVHEDEYTNELLRELNTMRHSKEGKTLAFTHGRYQDVVRGANLERYDGQRINSQPDITIRKVNPGKYISEHLAHLHALFIECKIIDDSKRISDYFKNGIMRYIDGQYSWSMSHSIMIAYVKNKKSTDDLKAYLKKNGKTDWAIDQTGAFSVHDRKWKYTREKYGNGGHPKRIKLLHIWLKT